MNTMTKIILFNFLLFINSSFIFAMESDDDKEEIRETSPRNTYGDREDESSTPNIQKRNFCIERLAQVPTVQEHPKQWFSESKLGDSNSINSIEKSQILINKENPFANENQVCVKRLLRRTGSEKSLIDLQNKIIEIKYLHEKNINHNFGGKIQLNFLNPQKQPKRIFRILCIDGGGIRGLIPAHVLHKLKIDTNAKEITDHFHMIAGTSAGGIIAAGLGAGVPIEKISALFHKNGKDIFDPTISMGGLLGYRYSSEKLNELLKKLLGNKKLSEAKTELLISTYDLEKRDPLTVTRHAARKDKYHDFLLRDIAQATGMAPTYFKSHKFFSNPLETENNEKFKNGEIIEISNNLFDESSDNNTNNDNTSSDINSEIKDKFEIKPYQEKYVGIDGGVFANNPTINALSDVFKQYSHLIDEIELVSLGTGKDRQPIPEQTYNKSKIIGLLAKTLDILLTSVSDNTHNMARNFLPDTNGKRNYYRINVEIEHNLSDMANTKEENIERLHNKAEDITNYSDSYKELVEHLIKYPKQKIPGIDD